MAILVLAEHDNVHLKPGVTNAVAAAQKIGGDIHVLIAGNACSDAANAASAIAGVSKVLVADAAHFAGGGPENLAPLLVSIASDYSHLLTSASAYGKNVMPRVAALLDVAQISEIIGVEAPDTFVRPIYAGNAFATVQSSDAIKVITVRATGFDAVPGTGGTAATTINIGGPGTVRLGAASDFDGSWNVASGARLELGATAALGDTAASGVTLAGGALAAKLNSATVFTGQTNLTLTTSSSLFSDRSSAGAGVTHTFGTVAMGAHTLTVAPGGLATSGTAGVTVGNVTLTGNPTFAVNDAGATTEAISWT